MYKQRISFETMAQVFRYFITHQKDLLQNLPKDCPPITFSTVWTFEEFLQRNKQNFQYYEGEMYEYN